MRDQTKPGLQGPVSDLKEEQNQTEVVKPADSCWYQKSESTCIRPSVSETGWGCSGGKAEGQYKGPSVGSDRSQASTKQTL